MMFSFTCKMEFSDKELDYEIKSTEEEINACSSELRRLYCYLELLKTEKEKRKNEKI